MCKSYVAALDDTRSPFSKGVYFTYDVVGHRYDVGDPTVYDLVCVKIKALHGPLSVSARAEAQTWVCPWLVGVGDLPVDYCFNVLPRGCFAVSLVV